METALDAADPGSLIANPHLRAIYAHWAERKGARLMPSRADLDPLCIPPRAWPNTMLLDVVHGTTPPRLRYRRVGEVYWQALGFEPTGRFVDEVLPETAGYRAYVVGIYAETVASRRPLYTENCFALQGQALPMLTRRVSLPLSSDGVVVDKILAGHVFEYGSLSAAEAFSLVRGLQQGVRTVIGGDCNTY